MKIVQNGTRFFKQIQVRCEKMATNKMTTEDYELAELVMMNHWKSKGLDETFSKEITKLVLEQHKSGEYDDISDDEEDEEEEECREEDVTRRECYECRETKSCGLYNENHEWRCVDCCGEEEEEDYEVICECCKHGLTREELDERTEKGFNSICFDCEPK
jgi:hypothetical protein